MLNWASKKQRGVSIYIPFNKFALILAQKNYILENKKFVINFYYSI